MARRAASAPVEQNAARDLPLAQRTAVEDELVKPGRVKLEAVADESSEALGNVEVTDSVAGEAVRADERRRRADVRLHAPLISA